MSQWRWKGWNDASDRAIHEGIEPTRLIASYLRAVNTGAKEESASFADDAVVVDVNRELRGLDAITAWAGATSSGLTVFDVLDVTERPGRTIVRVKIDGTFDRTGLPDPLVMNHEFKVARERSPNCESGSRGHADDPFPDW